MEGGGKGRYRPLPKRIRCALSRLFPNFPFLHHHSHHYFQSYGLILFSLLFFPAVGAQAKILFTKVPSSQDTLSGRSAILRCEVDDPSNVEFEWLHNGIPVQDSERRFRDGSNLQFTSVNRQQDGGSFQCVARNVITGEEARTSNASFNIKCEYLCYKTGLLGPALALLNPVWWNKTS